ncbi:MAG: hypothetical protein K1X94_02425 [Sandaracinaceae bacterium]|nr:hypothetical protein [Sandaracinaceae bacterium]
MASETKSEKKAAPERYRIPREAAWANAWKLAAGMGVVGLALAGVAWSGDPHRFAFSWLFAFMTVLAIALGCLFFVIIQHMAGASWSVSWRRVPEIFASGLPVFALLFLPIAFSVDELYPWMEHQGQHDAHEQATEQEGGEHASGESILGASTALAQEHGEAAEGEGHAVGGHEHTPQHAQHAETIEAKVAFLNPGFFYGRALLYFAVWALLSWFFVSRSTSQDTKRDFETTKSMQSWAPLSTFAFALTLTFAAFDWMMSLEPAWYSTIFGVQYFSVAAVSSLATIIAVTYALKNAGILGEAVQTEHYHDLGKLMFGFLVFWAYISFSQFMLIWYASIPEETTYYHMRWNGGWQTFTLALALGHFIFPFFFLMSRNIKRRVSLLAFGAAWLLVMHVLECFWLVMPYANEGGGLELHWMDVASVLAVGGCYLAVVFFRMTQLPLIPVGDPRLQRSLRHEVV